VSGGKPRYLVVQENDESVEEGNLSETLYGGGTANTKTERGASLERWWEDEGCWRKKEKSGRWKG